MTTTPKNETAATKTPDTSSWKTAGRNVRFHTLDGMLFIAVNTTKKAYDGIAPTAKGNVTIASTLGNIAVTDTLKLGLNIYGPPPAV